MYKSLLFASLAVTPLPLYALDTRQAPTEQLLKLGNELGPAPDPVNGNNSGTAFAKRGYLQAHATQVHFTVPATLLPELARQTLAQADQVHAVKQTRALYRRDFPDRIIGKRAEHAFRALCLLVDWRALPQDMSTTPKAYLRSASLLSIYPCD